jgi:hypothetical protein
MSNINKYPFIDPGKATCSGASVVRSGGDNCDENEDPNPVMLKTDPPILEQRSSGGFNLNLSATHAPASPPSRKDAQGVPQTKLRPTGQLLHPRAASGAASSASVKALDSDVDEDDDVATKRPAPPAAQVNVSSKKRTQQSVVPLLDIYAISSSSPPKAADRARLLGRPILVGSAEHKEMLAGDSVHQDMIRFSEQRAEERRQKALQKSASAKGSRKTSASATVNASRNPKDWDLEQDVALLTEVVEGETFLMIKSKGAKVEKLQMVRRSQGIPHKYNGLYWQAIIEKLETYHHEKLCVQSGKSLPLFPLPLKADYVKSRFDLLVSMRASKAEQMKAAKASKSNADDWESGKGDDSEQSEDAAEAPNDKDKKNLETRDSLLDAYLAQVCAFGESSAAGESVGEVDVFSSAEGGTKRPKSGQLNEDEDDDIIEANANGSKKKSKLPKLPKVSHAELCQSQALDHQSRVNSGFEALAVSQRPDTPDEFSAKMQSGALAISNVIGSTIAGAIQAWAECKKADRACLRVEGHEFAPIPGTTPSIILCKHCGMRV